MKNLIEKVKGQKIFVIGDLMLDIYLRGRATRISPEAPVPIVLAEKKELIPGGAANVMVNLKGMGCSVYGAGFLGLDYEGDFLLKCLHHLGINTDCILQVPLSTIHKTRVLANGQHVIRYDFDSDFSSLVEKKESLLGLMQSLAALHSFDAVVVSDYAKGTICQHTMDIVKGSFDCPILCDTKPNHSRYFSKVWCVTPNLTEAGHMLGLIDEVNPSVLARSLKKEMSLSSVIITLSDDGMLLLDEKDQELRLNAYTKIDEHDPRRRFDVTGAGDTVLSVFAACVAAGLESRFAAFAANVAAGVVVNKTGTAVCTFEELHSELQKGKYHDGITAPIQ